MAARDPCDSAHGGTRGGTRTIATWSRPGEATSVTIAPGGGRLVAAAHGSTASVGDVGLLAGDVRQGC